MFSRAHRFIFLTVSSTLLFPLTTYSETSELNTTKELSMPGVKLLVVEFYATWCKPCMEAVPKWKELHRKYASKGLRFIVVSEEGKSVCSKPDWSPDVSVCDKDEMIQNDFGVKQLPQSFLYSWEGKLAMTSHHVEAVEEAIIRYFKDTNLTIVVPPPDVIGDKYAVSSNPVWVRDFIIEKIRDASKFDVVNSTNFATPASKSDVCEKGFPQNSVLRTTLQGDDRGNRNLTLSLEKEGCVIASATEKYLGKGMNEDIDSMKIALGQAVYKIIAMVIQPKAVKFIDEGDEWFKAAQEKVIVHFESEPAGARLFVDGQEKCSETPCSEILPKGIHEIMMQMVNQGDNYLTERNSISLEKDTTVRWELKIKPNSGWLTVTSEPSGIEIKVDGNSLGKTPVMRRVVSAGEHDVITASGCFNETREKVVVAGGQDNKIRIRPVARVGIVEVNAHDRDGNNIEADVYFDGRKEGVTPGTFRVNVCAKEITVESRKAGTYKGELNVMENRTIKVEADLEIPKAVATDNQEVMRTNKIPSFKPYWGRKDFKTLFSNFAYGGMSFLSTEYGFISVYNFYIPLIKGERLVDVMLILEVFSYAKLNVYNIYGFANIGLGIRVGRFMLSAIGYPSNMDLYKPKNEVEHQWLPCIRSKIELPVGFSRADDWGLVFGLVFDHYWDWNKNIEYNYESLSIGIGFW